MATTTILIPQLDTTSQCGRLIFTDATAVGSGTGYDVSGGMHLSTVTEATLSYTNLSGTSQGYLWATDEWIPATGDMSYTTDYPSLLGVYELTYSVTGLVDGSGELVTLETKFMALFDCAVIACLKSKVLALAKQGCGCCGGCGNGLDQAKVNWMYAQLSAVQIAFEEGYYDCLDGILQSVLSKCDNACSSC